MSWSRRELLRFGALMTAAGLGGCGAYRPLYGSGDAGTGANVLERVELGNMANRSGQLLRNSLIDHFYHGDYPAQTDYRLEAQITTNQTSLALRNDSSSERTAISTTVVFQLVEKKTGKLLLNAASTSDTGVAGIDQQYGVRAAQDAALERTLKRIAEDITLRVATELGQKT